MTQLVDDAVEALERQIFFDRLTARYAELRSYPEEWERIEAERTEEERSPADGTG
jgi:hypothetical protein